MMRVYRSVPMLLLVVGCGRSPEGAQRPTPASPEPPSLTATSSLSAPAASGTGPADAAAPPTAIARWTEGLKTPESVLYDAERDRYLVSNINGKPVALDDNGFISELSPDGTIKNLYFISGGRARQEVASPAATGADAGGGPPSASAKPGGHKPAKPGGPHVTLDAPKGLAIAGGILYVADLTFVRMFDAATGAPKGELKIPGSTFLNDVAAGPDGKVYVSDSGLKMDSTGFAPTGTDAVFIIEKGRVAPLAKGKELERPNGLVWTSQGLVAASFGSGGIYLLDSKGTPQERTVLPKGGLDGLVSLGGDLLVSSWDGKAVYRGKLSGQFTPVLQGQESPADIGFDTKRSRILVPHFTQDAVEAYAFE